MNNGAKLLVALVLVFAGAGLYMAFFPPGGSKPATSSPDPEPRTTPSAPPSPGRLPANERPGGWRDEAPSRPVAQPPVRTPTPDPVTPRPERNGTSVGESGASAPSPVAPVRPTPDPAPVNAGEGAADAPSSDTPVTPAPTPVAPAPVTPAPVTPAPVVPAPPRPAPAPSGAREYIIIEGDTFTSIAEEYFGDRRKVVLIVEANPGVDPNRLAVGQRIRLPAQDTPLPASATTPAAGSGSGTAGGSTGGAASGGAPPADQAPTATAAGRHIVKRGETLAAIAERYYGTKAESAWRRIFEANRSTIGDDPSRLRVGDSLVIPARGTN
ncbi:MAG: LysM peptidoglycan-binding domain-containing protein [Phycisphaeraceae bacterium]|nr:LysM peptidoglycan-binding domain-containing protein [Phycisphaeraceae bacterium]